MGNDYLMRQNKMLHQYIVNTTNTKINVSTKVFSKDYHLLKISKNGNNWKHI